MAQGITTFPDGFAHTMNRAEIDIVYPTFPEEVHELVDRMLEGSEDRIQTVHGRIDTPVLAIQSVAMNIGGRLPTFDHVAFPDMTPVGETKQIQRGDTFAIAEDPTLIGDRPTRFTTVLERVAAGEPVDESEMARNPSFLRALFHMGAANR